MSFSLAAANATEDPSGGGGQLLNSSSSSSQTTADSTGAVAARSLVLALLMAASCCTNVLLIIVLQYSRTLRRRSVYRLVCSVCVVKRAGHPAELHRGPGAFAVSMVDHLWLFSLLLLASDRLWALRDLDSYRRRFPLAAFSTFGPLPMALALPPAAAPLAVPSSYVSGRFVCGSAAPRPLPTCWPACCLGFLLPFATLCLLYVAIVAIGAKETERAGPGRTLNLAKMNGALLAAWILLAGPYTVAVSIDRSRTPWSSADSSTAARVSRPGGRDRPVLAAGGLRARLPLSGAGRAAGRAAEAQPAGHCKTPKSSNHVTDGPRLLHGGGEANVSMVTETPQLSTRAEATRLQRLPCRCCAPEAAPANHRRWQRDGRQRQTHTDRLWLSPGAAGESRAVRQFQWLHMQPAFVPTKRKTTTIACDVADSRPDISPGRVGAVLRRPRDISGDEEAKKAASSAAAAASAPTDPELPPKDAEPQQAAETAEAKAKKKAVSAQEPAGAQKQEKEEKEKAAAAPRADSAGSDSSFNSQSGLLVASGDLP
uniref:G_PROTEIN_RECEP_F1_2 domain-containing protein n=1 Tax=Macrostomum lignano TaxID=282301 RepID=A0A1I8FHS3_9PLAT